MRIRPASAQEANRIANIHEQTACVAFAHIFPDQPFPRTQTIERWQKFPGRIYVAEDGDVAIGFVAFDETELHALYVLPSYQGKGVGSQLLKAAGDVRFLCVLQENHVARRYYESHGWMPEGSERSAFGVIEMRYYRYKPSRQVTPSGMV